MSNKKSDIKKKFIQAFEEACGNVPAYDAFDDKIAAAKCEEIHKNVIKDIMKKIIQDAIDDNLEGGNMHAYCRNLASQYGVKID